MKQLKMVEKMKDKWISLDNWEANDAPGPSASYWDNILHRNQDKQLAAELF
jgi:hypothetical protein